MTFTTSATFTGCIATATVIALLLVIPSSADAQPVPEPDTEMEIVPWNPVNEPSGFFMFSTDFGVRYECQIDMGGWIPCTERWNTPPLADGPHFIQVRAVNVNGVADTTPKEYTWVIDTDPPDTLFDEVPTNPSTVAIAHFDFDSDESPVTYECRLDEGVWAACPESYDTPPLNDGEHTLEVRATDDALNTDPTPASHTWTVIAGAPDTFIDFAPSSPSNDPTGDFLFSTDTGVTYECQLDAGGWGVCLSAFTTLPLTDGEHTLEVRAINIVGTVDPTPASHTWTTDTGAPDTFIDVAPESPSNDPTPDFEFSTDDGVRYECRIDAGIWADCPEDYTTPPLTDGEHTLEVRAYDDAGNVDPTPATHTWTSDTGGPDTFIDVAPEDPTSEPIADFEFSTDDGVRFECMLDAGEWFDCDETLTTDPLPEGEHTLQVRAYDGADVVDPTPAEHTWTIDTSGPVPTVDRLVTEDVQPTVTGTYQADDLGEAPTDFCVTIVSQTFCRDSDALTLEDGVWSLDLEVAGVTLEPLTYDVIAEQTDAAGNTGVDETLDEVTVGADNCPEVENSDQADLDEDGIGDVCDDDMDGDEIPNDVEEDTGTDPRDPDTDDDGLCDGPISFGDICEAGEDLNGNGEVDEGETDPRDADTDDDGLLDGDEADLETDPTNPDTDGDGIQDGTELGVTDEELHPDTDTDTFIPDADPETNTDPTDPDTDDDELCDGPESVEEVCTGGEDSGDGEGETANGQVDEGETDPLDPDSDDDNLTDGEEVLDIGSDPLDPDTDDGGIDDGVEVDRGTDPLDPADDFAPARNLSLAGGSMYGCSSTGGPAAPWGLFLFLGALVALRRRGEGRKLPFSLAGAFIALTLSVFVSAPAAAQDGFDAQGMTPATSRSTAYWNSPFADTLDQGAWDLALFLNYADSALVLYEDNERVAEILSAQMTSDLMASIGLHDRLDIGIAVPLVLYQDGESVGGVLGVDAEGAGFGVGDIRLAMRAAFLDDVAEGDSGVMFGADVTVRVPTGDSDLYQGGELRAHPRLLLDYVFANRSRMGVQVGYLVRPTRELENVALNDQLTISAAGAINVGRRGRGWLIPELQTQLGVLEGGRDVRDKASELLFGGRYDASPSVSVEGGTSVGLISGAGSPDWRLFAGISVHAAVRAPLDTDGDGYLDPDDACPLEAEDFDGFEDLEGCPDPDNDADGVPDIRDGATGDNGFGVCLNDPEDMDGFEDTDGCPDLDNDGDGVPDIRDGETGDNGFGICLNDPEDFDGYEDTDGCPDLDNDQDGVPDVRDGAVQPNGFGACMNDPEDMDGDRDSDGCPEEDRAARVTCDSIDIDGRVYFDLDSDVIQTRSFRVLDDVASVLEESTFIRLLSVEGHTDSQGSSSYNRDLSERRAASVMRYLDDRGIDGARLLSRGWGEEAPIDTNGTEEGRQNNRRVEFIIVEQDDRDCVE